MEKISEKEKSADESSMNLPTSTMKKEEETKTCETKICEDNKSNIRIKVSSTDEVVEVSGDNDLNFNLTSKN